MFFSIRVIKSIDKRNIKPEILPYQSLSTFSKSTKLSDRFSNWSWSKKNNALAIIMLQP